MLCAVEEGEEAEAVLTAAAAFASGYKARLSLIHVLETPPSNVAVDFSPYKNDLMDAADFNLRELKGKLGIDAPHAILDGGIPEGIRQEAVRRNADFIITGCGTAQTTFSSIWSRLYPSFANLRARS